MLMKPIFECQNVNHCNEIVTGVDLGYKEGIKWVCSLCLVEHKEGQKTEFLSFQQIIQHLTKLVNQFKKFQEEKRQELINLITKFENVFEQLTKLIQVLEKSIILINSEQFANPLLRQTIGLLKSKAKSNSKKITKLVDQDEDLRRVMKQFEDLGNIFSNQWNDLKIGDYDQTIKYLKLLDEIYTPNSKFLVNKAKYLIVQRKYNKAFELWNQVNLGDQENYVFSFLIGYVLKRKKMYEEALKHFQRAEQKLQMKVKSQEQAEIKYQIGKILLKLKRKLEAFTLFDDIIQTHPNYDEPYIAKIKHLIKTNCWDQANKCCNNLLQNVMNCQRGNFYKGLILLALNNITKAKESFQKVLQIPIPSLIPAIISTEMIENQKYIQYKTQIQTLRSQSDK